MAPHWNPEDEPGRTQVLMIRDWPAVLLPVVYQFWSLRCWTVPFCPCHTYPTHIYSHLHIPQLPTYPLTATPMQTHCYHTQIRHSILTHSHTLNSVILTNTHSNTIPLPQSYPTVTLTHTFIPTPYILSTPTPNYIQTRSYYYTRIKLSLHIHSISHTIPRLSPPTQLIKHTSHQYTMSSPHILSLIHTLTLLLPTLAKIL